MTKRFINIVPVLTAVLGTAAYGQQNAGGTQVAAPQQMAVAAPATTTTTTNVVEAQNGPVVIQAAPTVVKQQQPTTYVEASPLGDSRAEALRRQRQEYELQTEQKIVEKLEASRLEDEQRRAERLFGTGQQQAVQTVPTYTSQPVAPVQQQAVVPAAPTVIVAPVDPAVSQSQLDSAKKEIIQAIEVNKGKEAVEDKADGSSSSIAEKILIADKLERRYYMTGMIGAADYPDASNVTGQWAGGFKLGMRTSPNLTFEGLFLYSNYFIDETFWNYTAMFKDVDQYNLGLNLNYNFAVNMFKPFIGTGVAYTYRKYTDRLLYNNPPSGYGYIPPDNEAISHAFDWAILGGVDVQLTRDFSVGVEYRYSFNLYFRSGSAILNNRVYYRNGKPLEEFDYGVLTFSGKYIF